MKQEVKIDKDRHEKMFGKQEAISLDGVKHDLSSPIIDLSAKSKAINEQPIVTNKQVEIQPIGSWIYTKEDANDGFMQSEGGIILGRAEESDYKIGTVISVGPKVVEVKAGDKFMYHKAAIAYLECYGNRYPLMEEKNVICKIK